MTNSEFFGGSHLLRDHKKLMLTVSFEGAFSKNIIQELKKDLAEIKRDYAVLVGDKFWRYEFKSVNSHSFTHVYCRICNEVRLRDDWQVTNCFLNHCRLINLERYVSEFYSINIDKG